MESKTRKNIKFYILVILIIILMGSTNIINRKLGIKDDNIVEEAVEEAIKVKTGMEVDLTPESKEQ